MFCYLNKVEKTFTILEDWNNSYSIFYKNKIIQVLVSNMYVVAKVKITSIALHAFYIYIYMYTSLLVIQIA